ncbi:hypothetical protein Ahy_A04g020121 [Arachis hypogaea]|uniref:MULE transposase domain-containing protein n=1 Tax=Arachis hypogaea TaxID=3818 RepID=A0A445DH23_ARAHY|nr:hypothetical protein Ahy_A04g020121 [Arachis hypogaea]
MFQTRRCQRIREVPIKNEREEPKFLFELNLKGNHSIKYALWADARSRTACEYFEDVVSFDTTYNTNRYNLVFCSFVGINHRDQSTLLGCSPVKNEDIQSLKWIFGAFEMCMPITIHRWCIWQNMKKIPNKLNGYKRHEEIEQEMSHVVCNWFTKDAFDRNWNDFLTKYCLGGNKWLSELYDDWHIWIPIYLDHHFWARMRST